MSLERGFDALLIRRSQVRILSGAPSPMFYYGWETGFGLGDASVPGRNRDRQSSVVAVQPSTENKISQVTYRNSNCSGHSCNAFSGFSEDVVTQCCGGNEEGQSA